MTAPIRKRWIGFKTLIARECAVIVRFWSVTLAPPAVMTILYFVVFGEIIGKRLGSVNGVDYVQYLAPGLIVLWVIPYSFGHTSAGLLGARFFRYIEEVLVSPLPDWVVMMAYVVAGMVRGFLVGLIAAIVTLLFTHLHVHSIGVSIAVLSLTALVSAVGGFIAALFAKTFEQVSVIQSLILTPLTYVAGVFAPVSALPDWAQTLSLANPMFYMVNAFRYGFLGVADVPVGMALSMVLVCAILLVLAAMKLRSAFGIARGEDSD